MALEADTVAQITEYVGISRNDYDDDIAYTLAVRSGQIKPPAEDAPYAPFLVLVESPKDWSENQRQQALDAAYGVFRSVGVDPAFYLYPYPKAAIEAHVKAMETLWAEAQRLASLAYWDAFDGEPAPIRLDVWAE